MTTQVVAENATTELVSPRYKLARDLAPGDVIIFAPGNKRTVARLACSHRHTGMHYGTGYSQGLILIGWADHLTAEYGAAPDHEFQIEGAP